MTRGAYAPVPLKSIDPVRAFPLFGLRELWARTTGSASITIAVLDGPVATDHPAFQGASIQTVRSAAPTRCRGAQSAACQHGTHIASIIFAQHATTSLRGVAPGCKGLVIPVFQDDRRPGLIAPCSQASLAAAIHRAVDLGADIINISAGQLARTPTANPALAAAVERAIQRDVLVVAAAGNDGCDCLHVPAALNAVLTVGSVDTRGHPATFSNFGAAYRQNGILAPGINILGALPDGELAPRTGTSFSAAVVSGIAALLMGLRSPRPSAAAIRAALLNGADPCPSSNAGVCQRHLAGRLNITKSVHLILQGVPMPTSDRAPNLSTSSLAAQGLDDEAPGVRAACAGSGAPCGCGGGPKPSCSCGGTGAGGCACGGKPQQAEDEETDEEEVSESSLPAIRSAGARAATIAAPRKPGTRLSAASAPAPRRTIRPSQADSPADSMDGQLVYALGDLWYDFGTQARYDSIDYEMPENEHPSNPRQLINYLKKNPYDCDAITWLLQLDATPIYAIKPVGSYAPAAYLRMLEFFEDQLADKVERVSIPGRLSGSATLMSGQQVPLITPEVRGMYNWTTGALVDAVMKFAKPKDKEADAKRHESIRGFLERVYFELRNLGVTSEERAINFAATNAFNIEKAFERAAQQNYELDDVDVERSPICRPDSDCWDVKLIFFNPANTLGEARSVCRFTVDVSDVVPVLVGPMREWKIR